MIKEITGDTIANEIRMERTQHKGSFVIVEGDSDCKTYEQFFDDMECQVVIAKSKDNAIDAHLILKANSVRGVLTIIDSDFMKCLGISPPGKDILTTDTHDLETMILKSPAFEKLLKEYGSAKKITLFKETHRKDILKTITNIGIFIGYLELLSIKDRLGLRFEGLSYRKFIEESTLKIDLKKLVTTIKNHSQQHSLNDAAIIKKITDIHKEKYNKWDICCGHDLMCILSYALRKTIGTNNAKDVKQDILEKCLRLSYEQDYFQSTNLYSFIKKWEMGSSPFVVMRKK